MKKLCKNLGHWFEPGRFSHDTQHERECSRSQLWKQYCHFSAALGSKAGWLLGPEVISWHSPSPHCTSLSELVQVRPTQHHKTRCKHIPITYLWYLSAYAFSRGSHKPLHKHNQNITCRRGQLLHWQVELYLRNKEASHRYLGVHWLHANLGWKWRTSIYNSPREIQIDNQLTCCICRNHTKYSNSAGDSFLTLMATKLIF